MKRKAVAFGVLAALASGPGWPAWATILTVGSGGQFQTIAGAVTAAAAGDVIQVAAGTYTNDFAPEITKPLTIEAAGGPVVLNATVPLPNDKGILLTTSSLTVKGLTFQGAQISDALGGNGAGIRDQSPGATTLRVENSTFLNNQNGILTAGSNNQETVQIIGSSFFNNGSGTGQTHALYVGDALSLLVQGSFFCGTNEGHNIKSRAATSTVQNTTSFDGATGAGCNNAGTTSYGMEFPNGGIVSLIDDALIQDTATHNSTMLAYGAEGYPYLNNSLSVTNTSFVSANFGAGIQQFGSMGSCTLSGTTFTGVTTPVSPAGFCTTAVTPPDAVPEPGSLALLGSSLLILTAVWRRRRGNG
jgi:hypothetical protein